MEAERRGLPVIPFLNGSPAKSPPIQQSSNNNEGEEEEKRNLEVHRCFQSLPGEDRAMPPMPPLHIQPSRQQSSLYLPMQSMVTRSSVKNHPPPLPLATAANYAPHSRFLNFGDQPRPLSVWHGAEQQQQQHCKSCTCRGRKNSELDYGRGGSGRGRGEGAETLGEKRKMHF